MSQYKLPIFKEFYINNFNTWLIIEKGTKEIVDGFRTKQAALNAFHKLNRESLVELKLIHYKELE